MSILKLIVSYVGFVALLIGAALTPIAVWSALQTNDSYVVGTLVPISGIIIMVGVALTLLGRDG